MKLVLNNSDKEKNKNEKINQNEKIAKETSEDNEKIESLRLSQRLTKQ